MKTARTVCFPLPGDEQEVLADLSAFISEGEADGLTVDPETQLLTSGDLSLYTRLIADVIILYTIQQFRKTPECVGFECHEGCFGQS